MLEFRQVNLIASQKAELMGVAVTTGFESKLRTLREDSTIAIGIKATTAAVLLRVQAGPELEVPTSPVPAGGTIGEFPKIPDDVYVTFDALAGDEISIELEETGAAVASVMAVIQVTPAG